MSCVEILIADDQAIFRRGLRSLISTRPEWHVCGEAVDGKEAVEKARQCKPDVVLLDVSMPEMNGLDAARLILQESSRCKILIVSQNDPNLMQREAVKAGAKGFVAKSDMSRDLVGAIDAILMNGSETPKVQKQNGPLAAANPVNARGTTTLATDSREQYRQKIALTILDTMNQFVGLLDAEGTVLEINQAALDAAGIQTSDVEGKPFWTTFWWQVSDEVNAKLRESIRRASQGETIRWDTEIYGRAGAKGTTIIDVSLIPVKDEQGTVVFITVEGHDITEKKAYERELAQQRNRISELLAGAPVAIGLLSGPEHRWTFVNSEYLKVTGRARANDFVGKTVRESLPEIQGQGFFELLDTVFRTGVPYVGTEAKAILHRTPNGGDEEAYFNFVYQPMHTVDGKVEGIAIHAVEVTNQVLAKIEIEKRERTSSLLASIVDSSDDAIISKTLDGIITSWNKSAERLFGYTAAEAVGQHIFLIIPRERRKEEEEIIGKLRRGERVDHFETVRVRKDGSTLDLSLTISPVKDMSGKVVGASKVARDISERKLAQEELRRSQVRLAAEAEALRQSEDRLRKLSEMLDSEVRARTRELEVRNADVVRQAEQVRELSWRLLRIQDDERRHISRELHDSAGQTLTVLGMNLAQLVQKTGRRDPELARDAALIQETVQQLHREIRTASYLLHPPLLDESGLSSALSWYVQGLTERSRLEIGLNISEDFGRLPREMELAVFRLVQECLTNIHRHSESKTASITIVREDDILKVDIRDQGNGIPPARLAEIQSQVSGVGIMGMRERLRQFQGTMTLESGSSGTRVLVTIPIPKPGDASEPSGIESMETAV
jgi:PAS domain S-box-containing protein